MFVYRKGEFMSVLVCENISKNKKNTEIIHSFSYNFLDNQIYAVIGNDTKKQNELLNLICGKEKPSTGVVYLDGEPLYNNNLMSERLCYISNETSFPGFLKVEQIFSMMAEIFPKWDNSFAFELVTHFEIDLKNKYERLNKKKKSLLNAILGLASLANITIFEHPIDNIESKERYDFFNFLYKNHVRYPRTYIISTSYIDEIDYLVNKVLFLDKGRLFAHYSVDEIKDNFTYLSGKTEVLKSLINGVKIVGVEERGKTLTVCIRQKLSKDDIRKYQKYLIKISEVPISSVFIYLINLRQIKEKTYGVE